ncbi:MAG: porphobilinogen synthase [Euryarchaeota archaeon]|nr:porphobilinogen synthase [Euryarchaeota archaeon]
MFPTTRMRRLRASPRVRDLVAGTRLSPKDLVYPIFVDENLKESKPVAAMPGIHRQSLRTVAKEAAAAADVGVPAVILFGIPKAKDEAGSAAYAKDGVVPAAIRRIKEATDLAVIADLCLCEYTSHGHCGLLRGSRIDNDRTVDVYGKIAVSQALAGADMVAPSGMMDGQVAAIRKALDDADFEELPVLAYSSKYASAFYGPFREAAESVPKFGDRRSHQMDPRTATQALKEARLDLQEGADIVMVKPALPYLDVLALLRRELDAPIAAFQVSGEYAALKAAGAQGWFDEEAAVRETLTAIKRAGADFILTYFAKEYAARV